MSTLGKNIKYLRKAKGLTQADLEDAMKVGKGVVSNWENDKNGVKQDELKKLSEIFSCSIDDLVGGNLTDSDVDYGKPTNKKTSASKAIEENWNAIKSTFFSKIKKIKPSDYKTINEVQEYIDLIEERMKEIEQGEKPETENN